MKIKFFAVAVLALVFLVNGCAGVRHATLKADGQPTITHDDTNISLLLPPVGPLQLAESYRIRKQADAYEKMMTGVQEGKIVAATNGNFLIGVVNNDSAQSVYLYHPEIPGLKLSADPKGGSQIFKVRDIPYEIVLYDKADKIIKKIRPRDQLNYKENIAHKKLIGNVLVDLRIKINRVN